MSIQFRVLGVAGGDNALLVKIDTGQATFRLLFDCGSRCLDRLTVTEIQSIDHLLFSHLHMDHLAGFDTFFRLNYDRSTRTHHLWGPPETGRILHHRFQGFIWNLYHHRPATWTVSDIFPDHITRYRFELQEAFENMHEEARHAIIGGIILDEAPYSVQAATMDHIIPSMAYIIREKPRQNIDRAQLSAMGINPGPWLQTIKDTRRHDDTIAIGDRTYPLAKLRKTLLMESDGEAIAYLTDFRLDDPAIEKLVPMLKDCRTIVCESCYRHADLALADRHHHMTARQAAELARRAGVEQLILIHLSDRYSAGQWQELLTEARQVFPHSRFPDHWELPTDAPR
jgi:ribonuclease Z